MRAAGLVRHRVTVLALLAAAAGLAGGFALKEPCTPGDWDGKQYRRLCYSDVVALYGGRGLDQGRFPYVDTDLEYPHGTGVYVGIVARSTSTLVSFVHANAVGLALAALGAALAIIAIALDPKRILYFAVAPSMVLYAFHNWDLLAVGFASFAMWAFTRRSFGWTGILLGLGAATKLYPAFLLPPFALALWRSDRAALGRLLPGFVLGAAVLNVPFMMIDLDRWMFPWDFQSTRGPNYETSWFMLQRHFGAPSSPSFINWISGALFVAGSGILLALEARRERIRPFAVGFGIVVLFLLTAKVFSPQYALWLLPFFVVLRLPLWSYIVFAITDAAVWIAVSAFFLAVQYASGDAAWRLGILEIAVWARYAALLALVVLSRHATELVDEGGRSPGFAPVALTT